MKIQDVKIFIVQNPSSSRGGPYFIFFKLITDNNIVGFGEVYGVLLQSFLPGMENYFTTLST